jgi:hypothetical protein
LAKVTGKPVIELTENDLANHAVCRRHAAAGREAGVRFFSFVGTIDEIARRRKERETGTAFFSLYGAMKKAGLVPAKRNNGNGRNGNGRGAGK